MRALILRERKTDNYDPDPSFGWIVEMDSWVDFRTSDFNWMKANFSHGNYFLRGRVIGFVDRDDALLFFLRFA